MIDKKNPQAKYRLHATKVDRIAVVDRPAVPDAQIVVFKRHKGERGYVYQQLFDFEKVEAIYKEDGINFPIEKGLMTVNFQAGFVVRGTQAAVDTLQEAVWDAIYGGGDDTAKMLKGAFADFRTVILEVLAKLVSTNKADAQEVKLTTKDITQSFARGLAITAMSEAFTYFRSNIAYLLLGYSSLENPEETYSKIISQFEKFVADNVTVIVANKREEVTEKVGRIISAERLRKLKAAMAVIEEIVGEAESRYSTKSQIQEADTMELNELIQKFETLSASVETLIQSVGQITGVMKSQGYLLTAEEQATADKAKAEQVEADKKAALEKRAESVGLPKDAVEADIEKKEKEIEAEKQKKEADAIEAEKKAKEEADAKAKADLNARFEKLEKAIEPISKFVEVASKRFGMKTSEDGTEIVDKSDKTDPFGDAMKGKVKKQ